MENDTNGTAPKGMHCEARKGEREHCWHTSGAPLRNPNSVMFTSVCCFCAPVWMHYTVFVPASVPDTELEVTQQMHGHLITMQRMPRQGSQLTVPGR